jgi:hypothetical protein
MVGAREAGGKGPQPLDFRPPLRPIALMILRLRQLRGIDLNKNFFKGC